jgi:TrmH family RNA methyltransferase
MDPSRVDVVLVRAARPANVAAACRAMKNMGLRVLRLVEPPAGLDRPEVRGVAYGAWDVLDAAVVHSSLSEAVARSALVVGTTGRADPGAWTPRRLAEEGDARTGGGRVSLVFGPEASGLRTDELDLCPLHVHIPTAAEQPSLNLAQAVLVLAYEIRQSAAASAGSPSSETRATAGELEGALQDLRAALLEIGFLNPDNPDAILAELRALAARAGPTPREATLLRGLARQVAWAGRIARSGGAHR